MRYHRNRGRGGARSLLALAAAIGLTLTVAACSGSLLDVQDPEQQSPEGVQSPNALPTLISGAIFEFNTAYSGGGNDDKILSTTAVFSDEMYSAGTFTTRTRTDARQQFEPQQGNTTDDTYLALHQARTAAIEAQKGIVDVRGSRDAEWALLKALQGYSVLALGENFCGNIPFSDGSGFSPGETGSGVGTNAVLARAQGLFQEVIDSGLGGSDIQNLATVGKARAQLGQGNFSEAGNTAASVPDDFVFFIEHSLNSSDEENPIQNLQDNGRYSVSDNEGTNGLDFRSAMDPRVPWVQDPGGGFDATIPLFLNLRYPNLTSDVPLATGLEARLIEAEAQLQAGNITGSGSWLDILNDLRSNVDAIMANLFDPPSDHALGPGPTDGQTLGALSDPGTQAARVDTHFRERAFWLYNMGHRVSDLRRLMRQYGRTEDSVWPTGPYFKGQPSNFGDDVAFEMHFFETNNENYNISACDPTQP